MSWVKEEDISVVSKEIAKIRLGKVECVEGSREVIRKRDKARRT